jgi:hypothetical protein
MLVRWQLLPVPAQCATFKSISGERTRSTYGFTSTEPLLFDHAALLRGQYYLLDEGTGLLYHDAPLTEWPELVGRLNQATGTVHPLGADGATKFFTQLDAWLRENKASRGPNHQQAACTRSAVC